MQKLTCPLAKVKFHASISYLETFLPLLKSSEIREIHNLHNFLTASSVAIAVLGVAVIGLAILSFSIYNDNIML